MAEMIRVFDTIDAPAQKVWEYYTDPTHIVKWNSASPDWHTPYATNDLKIGGRFNSRMESKDGSQGFDFSGTYTNVVPHKLIAYTMDDADHRSAEVTFEEGHHATKVTVSFEPETQNPHEMQRHGWQAILDSFKKYVESH